MTQVAITPEAARELRERVARYQGLRDVVMILGPMSEPRWGVRILSLKELADLRRSARENIHTFNVDGIPIVVVTHTPNVSLQVDLDGDALRIAEQ